MLNIMIIIYNFESDIYFYTYIHVCIIEDIVSRSQTQHSMKEGSGDMQCYCFFQVCLTMVSFCWDSYSNEINDIHCWLCLLSCIKVLHQTSSGSWTIACPHHPSFVEGWIWLHKTNKDTPSQPIVLHCQPLPL